MKKRWLCIENIATSAGFVVEKGPIHVLFGVYMSPVIGDRRTLIVKSWGSAIATCLMRECPER
jgi:hypothetical protein